MANPAIDPIRGKFPKPQDITAYHLTINSRPTEVEVEALAAYDNANSNCIAKIDELAYRYAHPRLRAIALSARPKLKEVLASLMMGEVTFGEANRSRQRIYGETDSRFQAEVAQIAREEQQRQSSHQDRQQAYYNSLGIMMLQKIQPYPPQTSTPPRRTNCYKIGNHVNCTHW